MPDASLHTVTISYSGLAVSGSNVPPGASPFHAALAACLPNQSEEVAVTADSKRWFTGRCGMVPEPAAVTGHDLTAKGEEVNG